MKRLTLGRSFLTVALAASAVAWGASVSHAYLKDDLTAIGPGDTPDYLTTPNWSNSPPLRKFVDLLPGAPGLTTFNTTANGYNPDGTSNLGQALYLAVPDTVSYPGSDYYEIQLEEYSEQMHSDLTNPTTQRGYRQTNFGTDTSSGCTDPGLNLANPCTSANNTLAPPPGPHHLGPTIIAQKDRPVRVKFINNLPATGAGGELFIPVDTSIMGAGPFTIDYDPVTKAPITPVSGDFSQNRATLHLHGGITPWISDGTPHQWITPANEATSYPSGVSTRNVSDMDDPGPGAQTFYWTNQQSARLMFYHDHAWGITRLNVYAGEAAGYLIQDPTDTALTEAGIIPADQIPLILEDKTFVDAQTIATTDPTWNWGSGTPDINGIRPPVTGDLWWPHIYMPAQNPFDITGIAPMGRWAYGPYFWPPTTGIMYPPVPNPYYGPDCDPTLVQDEATTKGRSSINGVAFCQPPEIPGTPNPSWGAEAFMDTPLVNGTAYPVLKVEPKAYRLRVLNASHDRFYNLQFYQADTDPLNQPDFTACPTCTANSEIRMLPALDYTTMLPTAPGWPSVVNPVTGVSLPQPATWPMDARPGGAPDWNMVGPDWIQIGTEGGFLPRPVTLVNNPVTWNNDVTTFNAGNVNGGTLILGPAERADAIVDFSAFAGRTLILYNDAPAPFPALDPHYDYFTGAPDMTEAGGAASTLAGMGPNTRTIMQIQVGSGTPVPFDQAKIDALNDAFNTGNATVGGLPLTPTGLPVFAESQNPIIVGQTAYNGIYAEGTPTDPTPNPTFPGMWPNWGISRISDYAISYEDVAGGIHSAQPLEPKAMQDEMGEVFDDYGRMSAKMGLEMAQTNAGIQTFVLQNFLDPSTEILVPGATQIWKITHNGVDTHPLHFHLYDVQILNRVGWDGFIRLPEANELGWKDTIRVSPLEDTIVALRPIAPLLPFGVPESIRPLNPMEPLNSINGFTTIDPLTGQARNPAVTNQMTNFDWEYVVHCHILSHEENDMMRTQMFLYQETPPGSVTGLTITPNGPDMDLAWIDPTPAADPATMGNSANEIGFIILRAVNSAPYLEIARVPANQTSFSDIGAPADSRYRVVAYNALGVSGTPVSLGAYIDGIWYLDTNHTAAWEAGTDFSSSFGAPGMVPVVGDWDGDGFTQLAAYEVGTWYFDLNGNGLWDGPAIDRMTTGFGGGANDIPVAGDWNGDGVTEIGIYRNSTFTWYIDFDGDFAFNSPIDFISYFGFPGCIPVVGDWDGDGIDQIAVYFNGEWYLDGDGNYAWDGTAIDTYFPNFGTPNMLPVAGDWTGLGLDRVGAYQDGAWYLDLDGSGSWNPALDRQIYPFGAPGMLPKVGRW